MSDHATPLGGTCSARFDPLRELFAAKLESGEDLGASLALNIDGEMVVDLLGGWADEARTVPWTLSGTRSPTCSPPPSADDLARSRFKYCSGSTGAANSTSTRP